MDNNVDDKTTAKIVDHIAIRDPQSGKVFVEKRGEPVKTLTADLGNSPGNSPSEIFGNNISIGGARQNDL